MKKSRLSLSVGCFLFLFGLIIGGCGSEKKPKDLIKEERYIDLLVEFQLLKTYKNSYSDTAQFRKLENEILQQYGITLEQFKRSHAWYQNDIKQQQERLNKAVEELNKQLYKKKKKDSASVP